MSTQDNLKLFISYAHEDETLINEFIKHFKPISREKNIEVWHDRKLKGGEDFDLLIKGNLNESDIICLFISHNFLASTACIDEKERAMKLKKEKGIIVFSIILSECMWKEDQDLKKYLAFPKDGKPVKKFDDPNEGWTNVCMGLKDLIISEKKIKEIKLTDNNRKFLIDAEMLTKAHNKKEEVLLTDIYVYPKLLTQDELKEYNKTISAQNIFENDNYGKIIIIGEDQSGKTSLCKMLYQELRNRNFIPVYISDKKNFAGLMNNKIEQSFIDQYSGVKFGDIPKERVYLIIDDFHFANNKEKHIKSMSSYPNQIVIVDDIFSLNIKDEMILNDYRKYKIKQYPPTLRDKLIRKWIYLDETSNAKKPNEIYHKIDKTTETLNNILGKVISNGIMPAYPFFIFSIISAYSSTKQLNPEITSQGYCYQALIYFYLRKNGIQDEGEIGACFNFLSVLAAHCYSKNIEEINSDEFKLFMDKYLSEYTLPIKKEMMLDVFRKTKILHYDSFGNYCFYYKYIYYFFVAKYLADNPEEESTKDILAKLVNNLHVDDNAYITIFVSHHSATTELLDDIELNAMCLFDQVTPATLSEDELSFFKKRLDDIIESILPSATGSPEEERAKRLEKQDKFEEDGERNKITKSKNENPELEIFERDLRRSIKTVEVMGRIIKNHAGSLKIKRLESLFKEAMNVYLRILSSFIELIGDESKENIIENYIIDRIKEKNKERKENKTEELSPEELKELSKKIFWNANFLTIYGYIAKIINTLGSDNLIDIISKVCSEINTPASFLIKHGNLIWHGNNMQIENIVTEIEEDGFSEIAKRIIKCMIIDYCSIHQIHYKDKQRVITKLKIPDKYLIKKT